MYYIETFFKLKKTNKVSRFRRSPCFLQGFFVYWIKVCLKFTHCTVSKASYEGIEAFAISPANGRSVDSVQLRVSWHTGIFRDVAGRHGQDPSPGPQRRVFATGWIFSGQPSALRAAWNFTSFELSDRILPNVGLPNPRFFFTIPWNYRRRMAVISYDLT